MKPTKRRWLAAFLSAVIFLLALTGCTPQVANSSGGASHNPTSSGTWGETSSKPSQISVSFGLVAQFPGIMHRRMEGAAANVREIDYSGGELKANLFFTNGGEGLLELGLFVFCDGVPTEYTLLDSGETGFYNVFQVEDTKTVKLAFTPDFDLNLGRIDFHVVTRPNEKSASTETEVIAAHAVLPEGYQAEGIHKGVIGEVEQARMVPVPEIYKAQPTPPRLFVSDRAVGTGAIDENLEFEIKGKEKTWISAYVSAPGRYRLVFLMDGKPFSLDGEKTVLDVEFGEGEMFSAAVPLKEMLSKGEHSLFLIATRVDEEAYQTRQACRFLSSSRYEIIN